MTTFDAALIDANEADGGGGMFVTGNQDLPVAIYNSTISNNRAIGGGGIGGRVIPVTIVNSTISGNDGRDVGGGLYSNGSFELVHVTIANNRARLVDSNADFGGAGINLFNAGNVGVTLINTLLSDNTLEPAGREITSSNCGCTGDQNTCIDNARKIVTEGYNLADDTSCNLNEIGDIENVDAMIGPLADNDEDGLEDTHALLDGSPAIAAGIAIAGVTTDQRGVTRDDPPDIGAFEEPEPEPEPEPPPPPADDDVVVTTTSSDGGGGGGGCMLTARPDAVDPAFPLLVMMTLIYFVSRRSRPAC